MANELRKRTRIVSRPAGRARSRRCRPACSGVSAQAARGTTAPLSATAMPRWPASTAFSSSKHRKRRRGERFALAVDADGGCCARPASSWSPLLRRPRRRKPLDAERPDRRLDTSVEHETRDRVGGDRRQQDAVAMMAGGVDQALAAGPARGSARRRGCRDDGRPTSRRSAVPRSPAPCARRHRAASAGRRRSARCRSPFPRRSRRRSGGHRGAAPDRRRAPTARG